MNLTINDSKNTGSAEFIDGIAGIYNKAFFLESGNNILQLAKRNKVPLSVCIIDIDNLEKINDVYSYDIGNQVIESISQNVHVKCRNCDLVGYLGEGKIGLILYDVSGINTNIMLDTLRQKLQHNTDFCKKKGLSVTVSVGACIVHSQLNTETLEAPYAQAYMATNNAKSKGKNCVVIY